jgi:uncharacterized membrane protein YraQ (UPF0718 family)
MVTVLVHGWWGLNPDTRYAQAAHFFIYDTVKIAFLLVAIIFLITLVRTWFDTDRIRIWLSGKPPWLGYLMAAVFGIITPFCSCSAIPLFIGFLQARIGVGVTFAFLISAPMNNEVAIGLLLILFGWKVTLVFVLLGLVVAMLGGFLMDRLRAERWVLVDVQPLKELKAFERNEPLAARARESWIHTADLFKKIIPYVLIGVGVGAWIHGYIPSDLISRYAGAENPFAVPMAVLMGVPMYANAIGVVPMVEALVAKGMLLGTALSFMMAVATLSLPEAMILKRVLSWRLIGLFFGVVTAGMVLVGYIINLIF